MKSRAHVIIYGYVHGVFFRSFVKNNAKMRDIRGWVRNISDGVEAVFEGEYDALRHMIEICKEGPPSSDVTDIDVKWEDFKGQFHDFEIKK